MKSIIGTSSIRRKIQLQRLATQVNVRDIRGNIDTRIKKLERKEYDAILLAYAGLKDWESKQNLTLLIRE